MATQLPILTIVVNGVLKQFYSDIRLKEVRNVIDVSETYSYDTLDSMEENGIAEILEEV